MRQQPRLRATQPLIHMPQSWFFPPYVLSKLSRPQTCKQPRQRNSPLEPSGAAGPLQVEPLTPCEHVCLSGGGGQHGCAPLCEGYPEQVGGFSFRLSTKIILAGWPQRFTLDSFHWMDVSSRFCFNFAKSARENDHARPKKNLPTLPIGETVRSAQE